MTIRHHTRAKRYVPTSPQHAELVSRRCKLVDQNDELQRQHKAEEAMYLGALERWQSHRKVHKEQTTAVCAALAQVNKEERELLKK